MNGQTRRPHPLIAHLEDLAEREDRRALAALRRGLGRPPGTVPEMHRHVMPFLDHPDRFGWPEQCCYIVAALFAAHPAPGGKGNLGDAFARLAEETSGKPGERAESVERRFVALLKADREDLFGHLRHAVNLARSKEVHIDYGRLLIDIRNWDSDDQWVQRNWSRSFWATRWEEPQTTSTGE